ncbi:MAG TPA: glycine cleavage system protein GcvH [Gammaproteobacteria bacterium]|nr:glycine cleavage system protein GcvH [Gammaproteobacteria bacterium]
MSENIPDDLRYTKSHEWVKIEDDGTLRVGITDHAQGLLGDMVYVEAPEEGREVNAEEACAVVESVKAASDIYSPVAGEVVEGNETLGDAPEVVNTDPYGEGWIMRIRPADPDDVQQLMYADDYIAHVESAN